jgi:hypothetical protein
MDYRNFENAFDGGIFRVGKTRGFIKPLALGWGF